MLKILTYQIRFTNVKNVYRANNKGCTTQYIPPPGFADMYQKAGGAIHMQFTTAASQGSPSRVTVSTSLCCVIQWGLLRPQYPPGFPQGQHLWQFHYFRPVCLSPILGFLPLVWLPPSWCPFRCPLSPFTSGVRMYLTRERIFLPSGFILLRKWSSLLSL